MIENYNIKIKKYLGNKVGIQATFENADILGELIRASSDTPPDLDRGPTASTLHNISSLQKPYIKTFYFNKIFKNINL